MYLKSRNILNLSCENRLYRVSNEKNIIDYIKEFFKKIIEYIKKFIDKIKQFFNFKEKQIVTKFEIIEKKVTEIKDNEVIDIEVITEDKNKNDNDNITSKDIVLGIINYKLDINIVKKIEDFCKYKYDCSVLKSLNKNIKYDITSFNNMNAISDVRNISVPEYAKKLCTIGDIPDKYACMTFFNSDSVYFYDFDILKGDFEKKKNGLNINKNNTLDFSIKGNDLKKILKSLDDCYKHTISEYKKKINVDLSLLTVNITKLEKELNNNLKDKGENITKDINNDLKILGQHTRFATINTIDIINTVDNTINILIDIIKDGIK